MRRVPGALWRAAATAAAAARGDARPANGALVGAGAAAAAAAVTAAATEAAAAGAGAGARAYGSSKGTRGHGRASGSGGNVRRRKRPERSLAGDGSRAGGATAGGGFASAGTPEWRYRDMDAASLAATREATSAYTRRLGSRLRDCLEAACAEHPQLCDELVERMGFAVNSVRVTRDGSRAYVHWSVDPGGEERARALLSAARPYLRRYCQDSLDRRRAIELDVLTLAPSAQSSAMGALLDSVDADRRRRESHPPAPVTWATAADVVVESVDGMDGRRGGSGAPGGSA